MGRIEHVVIFVMAGVEGYQLSHAPNPPHDDPNHRHEAWMARQSDVQHQLQYREEDIPAYFALARQYTLCDRYFSEVAGPSTPNHLMLICADAPIISNPKNHYRPNASAAYTLKSLPAALEAKGLSWGNYGGYAFKYVRELEKSPSNKTTPQFAKDAAAGKLPTVSWVYAEGAAAAGLSEHPLQNITDGMNWTVSQIDAVVKGGLWEKTAIFVTWDDWGGWFDHVVPPVKELWDPKMAQNPLEAFPQFKGEPFRNGSRVPCLVLGGYAKRGYVSKKEHSHISLVKFCETTFGIAPFNKRDADPSIDDMADCFDLAGNPGPPPNLAGLPAAPAGPGGGGTPVKPSKTPRKTPGKKPVKTPAKTPRKTPAKKPAKKPAKPRAPKKGKPRGK